MLDFLKKFPTLTSATLGRTNLATHSIETKEALPIQLHYYRCPQIWEEPGSIVKSTSPWAAPMFAVPKKNGSIRLVVDYRRLNQVTIPDPYVMPRIEVLLEIISVAQIFTTLDLKKGYYQVPVTAKHRQKNAFITEWGTFEFTVMPFGLRNAPTTFQRLMDLVLEDTREFAR